MQGAAALIAEDEALLRYVRRLVLRRLHAEALRGDPAWARQVVDLCVDEALRRLDVRALMGLADRTHRPAFSESEPTVRTQRGRRPSSVVTASSPPNGFASAAPAMQEEGRLSEDTTVCAPLLRSLAGADDSIHSMVDSLAEAHYASRERQRNQGHLKSGALGKDRPQGGSAFSSSDLDSARAVPGPLSASTEDGVLRWSDGPSEPAADVSLAEGAASPGDSVTESGVTDERSRRRGGGESECLAAPPVEGDGLGRSPARVKFASALVSDEYLTRYKFDVVEVPELFYSDDDNVFFSSEYERECRSADQHGLSWYDWMMVGEDEDQWEGGAAARGGSSSSEESSDATETPDYSADERDGIKF